MAYGMSSIVAAVVGARSDRKPHTVNSRRSSPMPYSVTGVGKDASRPRFRYFCVDRTIAKIAVRIAFGSSFQTPATPFNSGGKSAPKSASGPLGTNTGTPALAASRNSLVSCGLRDWLTGLRIQSRKRSGFESPLSHLLISQGFVSIRHESSLGGPFYSGTFIQLRSSSFPRQEWMAFLLDPGRRQGSSSVRCGVEGLGPAGSIADGGSFWPLTSPQNQLESATVNRDGGRPALER